MKLSEQKLFPPTTKLGAPPKPLPDFDYIYRELKAHTKFNLTLDLLWQEYREQHPEGYQYSQFCELYRRYRGKLLDRWKDTEENEVQGRLSRFQHCIAAR